jgi:hypothetical protein
MSDVQADGGAGIESGSRTAPRIQYFVRVSLCRHSISMQQGGLMTRKRNDVPRRGLARLLVALAAPLALLAFAAPAMAGKPTGEFANFSDCPLGHAGLSACFYGKTTSGQFVIGSTTVLLTKPQILQGGLTGSGPVFGFLAAADGNTLPAAPQTVPGGLLKILAPKFLPGFLQELFNEFINKGITGVTATTELVKTPTTLNLAATLAKEGIALTLPVRVHLENVFLGSGCYVGSSSHPVNIELTTGTTSPPGPNKPITGASGTFGEKAGGEILTLTGNKLVNNSFAAPEAEGCGGIFSFLIDPAVDSELELPSPAGHNTAILEGFQEIGSPTGVEKSE